MADLITHSCTALLWKVATVGPVTPSSSRWRLPPTLATFVLGTCLPDLLGRVPAMGLLVASWQFPQIPSWTIYFWSVFHMPVGIALTSVIVAQCWRAGERAGAFRQLLGGGMLHVAVDLLQTHLGVGYLLLFPFSTWDYEMGLIGSEDTVKIVPVLLPLTVGLCLWRWGRGRAAA